MLFFTLTHRGWFRWMSDELFLKIAFRIKMRKSLNLDSPKTFCEKIQWLKIYGVKSEFSMLVDKYKVKKYVSDIIGEKYIIPTLGFWKDAKEIDWDSLPDKFVLKVNHNSGGIIICKDKNSLDKPAAIKKLNKALGYNFYWELRERPYKDVEPLIIAEKFMGESDENSDLIDYKFFCFSGEPRYCQVIRDRRTKETIDFYDMNWNHQSFVGLNPNVKNGKTEVNKPVRFEEMKLICRKLSGNMPFVRIDLYDIDDSIYFGEITFYPSSGFGKFSPEVWDENLGNLINI